MRPILLSTLLLAAPALCAQHVSTHEEHAAKLIETIQRTTECLRRCQDEASIKQEIPQLKQLQREMEQIARNLLSLEPPSVAEKLYNHAKIAQFDKAYKEVLAEITRLQKAKLYTPELRSILQI